VKTKSLCSHLFQKNKFSFLAEILGGFINDSSAGSKVIATKKATITPIAEYNPNSLTGTIRIAISVRNPTAVVIEVRKVAQPTSLKVILMASNFGKPFLSSSI